MPGNYGVRSNVFGEELGTSNSACVVSKLQEFGAKEDLVTNSILHISPLLLSENLLPGLCNT